MLLCMDANVPTNFGIAVVQIQIQLAHYNMFTIYN